MNRLVLVVVCAVLLAGPPASVSAQTTHLVNLDGIAFIPADLTIAVGDTVRWVWVSGFHDVNSGETGAPAGDGRFGSGDPVFPPMTFDFVFDQAFLDANPVAGNVYPYYCSVHFGFGMTGTITVIRQGDLDRNGEINLQDHAVLRQCLAGPDVSVPPGGCTAKEFEFMGPDRFGDPSNEVFRAYRYAVDSPQIRGRVKSTD